MRKLIVNTFMTLDGIMQAPGAPEEDPDGRFEHGGWAFGYWDDVVDETMHTSMADPFDLLLGRKTYTIFAAHWPHSEEPAAAPLNNATKYVASTTLKSVEWQNSQLLEGPLADAVNGVKAQDGPEIQVQGSANLIQSLHADGLIDEFNVWTFPVILGKGKRLFEPGTPAGGLEVIDSKVSPSGVIMTRYRTGAEIKGGSFVQAELDRRATHKADIRNGPPSTWDGFGVDGNGDGRRSPWDPADAIPAAAKYLRAAGAPGDYRRAIFAYNHAEWYVAEVLAKANRYRGARRAGALSPPAGASVADVLANPRIILTALHRSDLRSGDIDGRLIATLAWIGRSHSVTVTSLKSDHSLYTVSGGISNHSVGRAMDIGAVDAEICLGDAHGRVRAARAPARRRDGSAARHRADLLLGSRRARRSARVRARRSLRSHPLGDGRMIGAARCSWVLAGPGSGSDAHADGDVVLGHRRALTGRVIGLHGVQGFVALAVVVVCVEEDDHERFLRFGVVEHHDLGRREPLRRLPVAHVAFELFDPVRAHAVKGHDPCERHRTLLVDCDDSTPREMLCARVSC